MAATPNFPSGPRLEVAAVSVANTNRDGTGTIVDIFTAGANGSKIDRVTVKATADPADSVVMIFVHDGVSYKLFDEYDMGNPAAASATTEGFRASESYEDLVLESGQKIAAAITAAPTAGVVNVFVSGGDF